MLRRIRIGIALLVIGLYLLTFWGGEKLTPVLSTPLLSFQLTPALVKWIMVGGGIAAMGFLCILGLTLMFGRVYCACLCPLGIVQDILIFFSKKIRRQKASYQRPHTFLRYAVFVLTVVFSILGTFALLNFLDPYSLFGRITIHLFKPVGIWLNNLLVSILEHFEVYSLSTIPVPPLIPLTFSLTLAFFLILLGMASLRGRMYCNTLCPVGTLLGMIARFSFYKMSLHEENCIACSICERGCRAGCINVAEKTIDATRCVVCFDCLDLCPKSAVVYTHSRPKARQDNVNLARRKLLALSASTAGSLIVASVPLRTTTKPLIPQGKSGPIVPPGALSVDHFTEACTACYLCVSVCPARAIQPGLFEYGLRGMMQPKMDYRHGYCAYECNLCGRICPTGAITPLAIEEKKLTQIGKAQFNKDRCVVYTKNQECGACVEVCPTHAVYTVERDNILYPETKTEHCTGCGRCENVCPVPRPKAIIVEGHEVHAKALEPYFPQQPVCKEQVQQGKDGFPF
jgi:formate hydrogenlyase subunit 6/NADH:ubiquinone oxidoreductase subunit I